MYTLLATLKNKSYANTHSIIDTEVCIIIQIYFLAGKMVGFEIHQKICHKINNKQI